MHTLYVGLLEYSEYNRRQRSITLSPTMYRVFLVVCLLCFLLTAANCETEAQQCTADGSCTKDEEFEKVDNDDCRDLHDDCQFWSEHGECYNNAAFMLLSCPKACDVCFGAQRQIMGTSTGKDKFIQKLQETKDYVEMFLKNETVKAVWKLCATSLHDARCTEWAMHGECDANPSYMHLHCAAVCNSCDLLDIQIRCPLDRLPNNAWGPGDLEKFFVNVTTNANKEYDVNILSQPPEGPWIVMIDNFFSPDEANRMIELGQKRGYNSSPGFGGIKEDGTVIDVISETRTSTQTWCDRDCLEDEIALRLMTRIVNLTSIPSDNQESFQLLSYGVGQFYKVHHDYIPVHSDRQPGVRILTVFLYLNAVEEGGGTLFPDHNNILVEPKVGRALIWPSVLSDDPHAMDPRTEHEALPVLKGHKYAANVWIHQRDYKNPHERNCQ